MTASLFMTVGCADFKTFSASSHTPGWYPHEPHIVPVRMNFVDEAIADVAEKHRSGKPRPHVIAAPVSRDSAHSTRNGLNDRISDHRRGTGDARRPGQTRGWC